MGDSMDLSQDLLKSIPPDLWEVGDELAIWQSIIDLNQTTRYSAEDCLAAWKQVFKPWNSHRGPAPCWVPSDRRQAESNLAQWMADTETADVREFHRWSSVHRQDFWTLALEHLEIVFRDDPDSVMAEGETPDNPIWLPGARFNIVESCFQAPPDQVAIIVGKSDGRLDYHSYGELRRQANQVSNALIADGLQSGDAIGVIVPMTFEAIAIYLGILQAGMIAVSIADSFAEPEIANRMRIAGAKAVVTYDVLSRGGKSIPLGARVANAVDVPIFMLRHSGDSPGLEGEGVTDWEPLVASQPDSFDCVVGCSDDPINILFSSGTTGDPKAIPWTQTTPIKCALDAHLLHDLQAGDVVAWPTNLGWMMGPWLIFATLINRGTMAIYEDAPFGKEFGKFVQDSQVSMLGVVPSMVRIWQQSASMEEFDWSGIKTFSSTGEASSFDDMFYLSWLAEFRPIIEYCGGTEIGGGYISSTVCQPNAPATFSTPAFGLDVEILDAAGHPSDEGELFLVPPSIGLSSRLLNRDHRETYFEDCPVRDGVQLRRHGDHMKRLSNGYFAAGGRADDTMNLGGIKVSSVEIEKLLNSLESISETAAVGLPPAGGGPDQLLVFYVCLPDVSLEKLDEDDLRAEMNRLLKSKLNPLFKVARVVRKTELPRTASNKVMRRVLRDSLR